MKTFSGSEVNSASGHTLSASATFSVSGNNLVIVLENTDPTAYGSALVPSDILSAVFFDLDVSPSPDLTFSNYGAMVIDPSSVVNPYDEDLTNVTAPPEGSLKGGWQFRDTTSSSGLGGDSTANKVTQRFGFGTVGLGIFSGNKDQAGWLNYALVGSGYQNGDGNSPLRDKPFIKTSVVLTVSGLPSGFDVSQVTNVRFQYGTSLGETSITGIPGINDQGGPVVPEPTSLALAGFAGFGFALQAFRRRRKAQESRPL